MKEKKPNYLKIFIISFGVLLSIISVIGLVFLALFLQTEKLKPDASDYAMNKKIESVVFYIDKFDNNEYQEKLLTNDTFKNIQLSDTSIVKVKGTTKSYCISLEEPNKNPIQYSTSNAGLHENYDKNFCKIYTSFDNEKMKEIILN